MIVCFCRRLTEAEIDAAIAAGARSHDEVFRAHGTTPICGGCLPAISARQSVKPRKSHAKKRRSSPG